MEAHHADGSRARPVHSSVSIHDAPGGGQCVGRSPVDRAKRSMNSTLVPVRANSSTKQRLAGELAASWFLRPSAVRAYPAAQSRSVGGDQAAPDPVLADVPAPQG
jgi:hypothetical protein